MENQNMTLLDKLRGKPLAQLSSHHATIYRQGSALCALLIVAIAIIGPELIQMNFGFGVVVSLFCVFFSTALAVRFKLSDGSEV